VSRTVAHPLLAAAIVKARFAKIGKLGDPGFRVVFRGTLRDLGVTEPEVDRYLEENREEVEAALSGA